jgi:hypothetical protein
MRGFIRSLAWLSVPTALGVFVACNNKGPTSPSTLSPGQPSGCAFTVGEPPNAPIGSSGAEFSVSVTTSAGCSWTASSSSAFVAPVGPASGTGTGSVRFAVQPNDLSPRQAAVIVAGKSLTIVQDGPLPNSCQWSVFPTAAAAPPGGSELKVEVTSTNGVDCAWTATANTAFMNVRAGGVGTGDGAAVLQVVPNNDPEARVGTATVAGQTVTVLQESSAPSQCEFTVTPVGSTAMPSAGGSIPVNVKKTQGSNCPWIAQSQAPFLIMDGTFGRNDGITFISVQANGFAARSGTVVIAGRTLTITQIASTVPCAFSISPKQATAVSPLGTSTTFNLMKTQGDWCPWTVESQATFLVVLSRPTGSNEATIYVQVAPNSGDSRTGTIIAGGQTYTVVQNGPSKEPVGVCSYRLQPGSVNFGAAASSTSVSLSTTSGENCPWNAQASSPFITVDRPTGVVNNLNPMNTVFVGANTGAARSGTVTFAPGVVLNVTQAAGLPSNAAAVIRLDSDAGDSILHGQSRSITLVGPQLETLLDPGQGGLTLNTSFGTNPPLMMRFEAPAGQSLVSGYYDHAQRFSSSGHSGLDVTYNGSGCNDLTGRVQINEAVFGSGGVVTRFHARFEQHCGNSSAALRGEVWIDAAGSQAPPSLPPFPSAPATPTTVFSFQSDPGDVIGLGQQGTHTLASAVFTPKYSTTDPEVTINIKPSVGNWSLRFRGPSGQFLTPGTYDPAGDPAAAGNALLRVTGPGTCSGSTLSGKFTVLEALYGTNGDVYRFRATFEARCGASSATLRGEIYVVADPWR